MQRINFQPPSATFTMRRSAWCALTHKAHAGAMTISSIKMIFFAYFMGNVEQTTASQFGFKSNSLKFLYTSESRTSESGIFLVLLRYMRDIQSCVTLIFSLLPGSFPFHPLSVHLLASVLLFAFSHSTHHFSTLFGRLQCDFHLVFNDFRCLACCFNIIFRLHFCLLFCFSHTDSQTY